MNQPPSTIRKRIVLNGILQGIGCRPTVFRLATSLGLTGWVVNTITGVHIEIQGPPTSCEDFLDRLTKEIPPPGRIESFFVEEVPSLGEAEFSIRESVTGERGITPIPPDIAVCSDCVQELLDPNNRRYLYPFITCTLCGPRFTVVRSFPYDRERTSMADFIMCPACEAEYHDPRDRRFHSQTNSCTHCGPKLILVDRRGIRLPGDPLIETIRLLMNGYIVAIKGIGGFHLACDATNEDVVQLLRQRKGRREKPFAVMFRDVAEIRRFCAMNESEEALLRSPVAPIVLLKALGDRLAEGVAPYVGTIGAMLPYTPLHHLLFRHPALPLGQKPCALVMTSGNLSEEPIVRGNEEAIRRLNAVADAFLMHNREIVLRADDSICRVIADRSTVFRRSRGLVPEELSLIPAPDQRLAASCAACSESNVFRYPVILGTGGDLKNALAIVKRETAVSGPHVGDLASPEAQDYFSQSIKVLTEYLAVEPDIVAVDAHPHYFSSSLARNQAPRVEEVFHHHAHAVSLLAQYGRVTPALFAVFDGTGYGPDGTIWGGEFLVADRREFRRLGHLSVFPLPGGEAAIREPVRILAGMLAEEARLPDEFLPLMGRYRDRVSLWLEAAAKGLNAPRTSSMGRLFDAVAAAAGFHRPVTFEGQPAMWLEAQVEEAETSFYLVTITFGQFVIPDARDLIQSVARDILQGSSVGRVAARFHNTVAKMVGESMSFLAEKTGIRTVGLTGGCFQNRLLTERCAELLIALGFDVLLHKSIPPNDGGIAIGQALVARERWCADSRKDH